MNKYISLFNGLSILLIFTSCENLNTESKEGFSDKDTKSINLLTDYMPLYADGDVNAIIEIPCGTMDKWELNKSNGQIEWEFVDKKPRVVNYVGYPGNYGMVPQTLLPKENGGDGDPLDILVLGSPSERGSVVKCKIIGVLFLMDRGEHDDKLIAISDNSPLYTINDIADLKKSYNGILEIIELWFTNYKGANKMESKGFGNKRIAKGLLSDAINAYKLQQ